MIDWNIIRAAGIGAFLMLWASVAWGLVSTTSVFGKKASKATSVALHQAFSTSGLLLLAMHLGFLVADRFMPFTPLDLVIPMRASYRPIGVTLGIAAVFIMVLGVLSTSWGRKIIGTKWWRRTHALSVPAFALALLHGLMTGTDSRRPAMFWMYLATAAILLFLLVLRAFTAGQRPQRTALPEGARTRAPGATKPATARPEPADVRPEPVEVRPQPAEVRPVPSAPPRRPRPSFAKPPIPIVIVRREPATARPPERALGDRLPAPPEDRREPSVSNEPAGVGIPSASPGTLIERRLAGNGRGRAPRPPPTNHGRREDPG